MTEHQALTFLGKSKQFLSGLFPDTISPDPKVPTRCKAPEWDFQGNDLFIRQNFSNRPVETIPNALGDPIETATYEGPLVTEIHQLLFAMFHYKTLNQN